MKTSAANTIELPNEILLGEVKRCIAKGYDAILRVRGNSMRPFLQDGRDKAKLQVADTLTLKIGDVVLRLADTAGIRETSDVVEKICVE